MREGKRLSIGCVIVVAATLLPFGAHAQLTTAGELQSTSPAPGTMPVRWPDVAHDAANDVYLAISGAANVTGRYLGPGGVPLGEPFVVNGDAGIFAQAPRVEHAPGVGFFVVWHQTIGDATRVRGRILRYGADALTGDLDVSPVGTNWEMGAAIAHASVSHEFLVARQAFGTTTIAAQRVSESGALLGTVIEIAPRAEYFRDPTVAYDAATDRFVVAYAGCVAENDCFVEAQRIQAGTGAHVGAPITIDAGARAMYTPEAAMNTTTGAMLIVWHRRDASGATFQGRSMDAEGALSPTVMVSALYGSYDANGLAYDVVSNTFVFVTHSDTASDVAIELSATGAPLDAAGLRFGPDPSGGNFNPRVAAASARAEWLAVTSTGFGMLTTQAFSSATRDPTGRTMVDAGARDDGGAEPVDGGAMMSDGGGVTTDGSGRDGGGRRETVAGCACRAGAPRSPSGLASLIALAWIASRMRRSLRPS